MNVVLKLNSRAPQVMRDKKLLVKVVRANGLGPQKGASNHLKGYNS